MNKLLKQYIREFDFGRPDWGGLPEGFPNAGRQGLTKEEKHLLEAIEMAWFVSLPPKHHATKVLNASFGLMTVMTVLLGIVMISYYVNVEYNLGFAFLTDLFA